MWVCVSELFERWSNVDNALNVRYDYNVTNPFIY